MNRTQAGLYLLLASLLVPACRGCEKEPTKPHERPAQKTPPVTALEADRDSLPEHLARARRGRGVRFVAPTPQEEQTFVRWTEQVARAGFSGRLPGAPPPDGFAGFLAEHGQLWVLTEEPHRKRGAGALVISPSSTVRLLVEAPHTFFDRNTLDIALAVFQTLSARALLVNTVHRGSGASEDERVRVSLSGKSPADSAHAEHTFFLAAHRALVQTDPALTTLQLHGFRDDAAPGVDIIVSAARTRGNAVALADALRHVLEPSRVRAYPKEIRTHGGTTNAQAAASRELGSQFFHLEMSASLRNRLKEDAALGERFAKALAEGVVRR
ncbi:MAG: hypothetical protein JW940_22955 [Polyangiaceae bacterium]|nr:hypothetical protein [Polyangiaceae bacterium]